mgnify:CR=1 FL=1
MAVRRYPPRNTSMRQERNNLNDRSENENKEKSPVNEKRVKPNKEREKPLSTEENDSLNHGNNKPTPADRVEEDDDIEIGP